MREQRWSGVTLISSGLVGLFAATALVAQPQNQPPLADQFEQAVTLIDTKADYVAAARVFEKVAEGSDRALAARALVYLGHCFERIGNGKAAEVYRRVIDQFPDQLPAVADARARLNKLEGGAAPTGLAARTLRPLWDRGPAPSAGLGRPSIDGRFLPLMDREGNLMLHDLSTQRAGPPIPIGKADGSLPACAVWSPPTLSPDASQVAFTCQPDGSEVHELRIVRTDPVRFAVSRLLTATAGEFVEAVEWSAPNTLLAQFKTADDAVRLAAVSLTGVTRTLVRLAAPASTASLSPDGTWVVFDGPSDRDSTNGDIFIASAKEGKARPLVGGSFADKSPMWAPDGQGIIFVSDRTGSAGLWYQAVANGRAERAGRLLFPDLGRIATVMGLTRSGKFLYFRETGLVDVWVVDLGPDGLPVGPPANASTRRIGQNLMPAWSPDGARLAYVSREQGIVIRDIAAGSEGVFGSGLTTVTHPRWSPSGGAVVVRGWDQLGRYGLFVVDVTNGSISTLKLVPAAEESSFSMGRWTRDGRAIVYALGNDVMRIEVDTRDERLLHTFPKEQFVSFGDVSPIDDAILFVQGERASGVTSLNVLTPDGALRRLLDSSPSERFGQPIWLPDARGVVFSRTRTDAGLPPAARRPTLWRMDFDNGAVRPLAIALDGPRDPAVAPDGRRMAFTAGYPTREPWVLENFLPTAAAPARVRR